MLFQAWRRSLQDLLGERGQTRGGRGKGRQEKDQSMQNHRPHQRDAEGRTSKKDFRAKNIFFILTTFLGAASPRWVDPPAGDLLRGQLLLLVHSVRRAARAAGGHRLGFGGKTGTLNMVILEKVGIYWGNVGVRWLAQLLCWSWIVSPGRRGRKRSEVTSRRAGQVQQSPQKILFIMYIFEHLVRFLVQFQHLPHRPLHHSPGECGGSMPRRGRRRTMHQIKHFQVK